MMMLSDKTGYISLYLNNLGYVPISESIFSNSLLNFTLIVAFCTLVSM